MNKTLIIGLLLCIPIISFTVDSSYTTHRQKGVVIQKTKPLTKNETLIRSPLNTIQSFDNVKKNDIIVLLVGNNNYREKSGFVKLEHCINDTRLFSRILTVCCKVPSENIHTAVDLTLQDFIQTFKQVIGKLKENQGFLMLYSGHGAHDGSLVFTDGQKMTPEVLKRYINSFENDTTLIIDACYSGNNEGPFEREQNTGYKSNCIRIYSSLAHLYAKEITYSHEYFSYINPFYEKVLNLTGRDSIKGNSYFISFIGYFFAEYDFSDKTNISFWKLMLYIFNKNNQYVEVLKMGGKPDISLMIEAEHRLEQHPKIFPLNHKVSYTNPNHEFLLIKKYAYNPAQQLGIVPTFTVGPFYSFGIINDTGLSDLFKNKAGVTASLRLSYYPPLLKGFFFGLDTGYIFTYSPVSASSATSYLSLIPIQGILGYHHRFMQVNNVISLKTDIGIGASLSILHTEQTITEFRYSFQAGTGIRIFPHDMVSISLDIQLYGIVFDTRHILLGLKFPIAVSICI